jgi:hypothetical protein
LAELVLLSGPESIGRHVVFIHGLRFFGGAAWLSSGANPEIWPVWLAHDIPGLAVWSIEHDSAPTRWRGHAMSLVDRANNLLPLVLREKRLADGDIAFVAHSFGGLILESLLRVASDRSATDAGAANFVKQVSRITFLGTPHHGSSLATLSRILRVFVNPSSATSALSRNDPNLRGLNQWFRHYAADRGVAIQTLTETRKTFLVRVVDAVSADPGMPSDPIPVDADHFGIASPASRASETYLHIRDFLSGSLPPAASIRAADERLLQRIAEGTGTNSAALERIERVLTAGAAKPAAIPRELVDAEAERRLTFVRKSRFFMGSEPEKQALRFAADLSAGDLNLASLPVKARGFAWCARLLMAGTDQMEARRLLAEGRRLASGPDLLIAEAFETAYAGDLEGALGALSRAQSPAARSAAFILIKNIKSREAALDWLSGSGVSLSDIDSDGQFFVIATQLDAKLIDDALRNCAAVSAAAAEDTPALSYVVALAHLASVVPRDLIDSVFSQPPFTLAAVPFADDLASLQRRRTARVEYQRAAAAARDLACIEASHDASDRALVLGLRDPTERDTAIADLQSSLRDSEHSLRRLPIALQFGIKLDLNAAEEEIDRQLALSGGDSRDAAMARFAISRTKSANESAEYIRIHRAELVRHLNPSFVAGMEVASLVESGQLEKAEERAGELLQGDSSSEERERLFRLIAEAREADPSASREQAFLSTNALPDLALLVDALERRNDWARLTKYAEVLFERTRDIAASRVYTRALFESGDFRAVVEFFRSHEDLFSGSEQLRSLLAWSLFNVGALKECRDVLAQLKARRDVQGDRDLTINLAITSGDWNSLAVFVEQEWERRADRTGEELLRAGQIAQQLGLERAKALIVDAAAKANDDPDVLAGCYSSFVSAGIEDKASFGWFERAVNLSNAEGPIQRVTLKELVNRQPDWQQREKQAWDQLNAGLIPMIAFAKLLNRSLAEVSLLPALANTETVDPRRRTLIYGYSGGRVGTSGPLRSLAIDPTALLIAATCGFLERLVRDVDRVVIPHSTLSWLFEERQRIRSHQPSRIADAKELRQLVDAGVLQKFEPTAQVDDELERQVGAELSSLFAEAAADWGEDHRPRRVVHSGAIHRAGSLMEERAQLGRYEPYLCGCLDVLDALVRQGRVTQAEEQRAKTFLQLHETTQTEASRIAPGSVLYMDGVALSHLQHIRMLQKFEASGFTVMLASNELTEGNQRIRYEALTDRANNVIEHIRGVLADGIARDKVVLGSRARNEETEDTTLNHPAFDILRVAALADVAVVDDRYFNQHVTISHEGAVTPIVTTFDLLSALQLTDDERTEYLSRLRAAAIAFIPANTDELSALLSRAAILNGELVESAELKAFRENLQLCRMSNGLQLPKESIWFDNTTRVLLGTIKGQWSDDSDRAVAAARSTWLLQLLDLRGWAHRYATDHNRGVSEARFRAQVLALMMFSREASAVTRRAYWEWLDSALVDSVRDQQNGVYRALLQDVSRLIDSAIARQRGEEHRVE